MGSIGVTIPARPDFVHVLRAVVAAAASRLGFTLDGIEDLRLAVDEACAHLLTLAPAARVLSMTIASQDGRLEVLASIDAPQQETPRSSAGASITWHILTALIDEATLEREPNATVIRMRKAVS